MGQYYRAINLDKRAFLSPHKHDNGAKLMEHSYIKNNFLAAVEHLLSPGQDWHKTRLVWGGDYMDEGLFIEPLAKKGDLKGLFPDAKINLYSYAYEHFDQIVHNVEYEEDLRYIVNHSKKAYIDKLKSRAGRLDLTVHPLSLLTSSGNGRGGGDYSCESKYVGIWAGDVISVEREIPDGFEEIIPDFIEE